MTKILVVDDEPGYPRILSILLTHEGFDVATAASAREALEVGRHYQPDLLIIDWLLGDSSDGIDVAATLQQDHPAMRTVVITGYPAERILARVTALPHACFLAKPFTPDELIELARRHLQISP